MTKQEINFDSLFFVVFFFVFPFVGDENVKERKDNLEGSGICCASFCTNFFLHFFRFEQCLPLPEAL